MFFSKQSFRLANYSVDNRLDSSLFLVQLVFTVHLLCHQWPKKNKKIKSFQFQRLDKNCELLLKKNYLKGKNTICLLMNSQTRNHNRPEQIRYAQFVRKLIRRRQRATLDAELIGFCILSKENQRNVSVKVNPASASQVEQ